VGSADFHFHVLEQVYVPEGPNAGTHTISWVQACAESVIFWLYTSLNSLAQELNLVYRFGIDEWKVDVTHPSTHDERPHSDCLKCRLIGEGDNLCAYLLAELDSDWFKLLNGLRNRITHRQLLSTNTNIGGQPGLLIEISHDPRARIFDEQPRTGIEIRGYCVQTRQNVVRVIGETYRQLIPRIGQI